MVFGPYLRYDDKCINVYKRTRDLYNYTKLKKLKIKSTHVSFI